MRKNKKYTHFPTVDVGGFKNSPHFQRGSTTLWGGGSHNLTNCITQKTQRIHRENFLKFPHR